MSEIYLEESYLGSTPAHSYARRVSPHDKVPVQRVDLLCRVAAEKSWPGEKSRQNGDVHLIVTRDAV